MITRFVKLVSLFVMLNTACLAQSGFTVLSTKPPHAIPLNHAGATPALQDSTVDNGIEYHAGPVLNKPSGTNVYFIWYGNWSGDSAKQILPDFVQHLGGSPYFNINTTYYDYGPQGQQDRCSTRLISLAVSMTTIRWGLRSGRQRNATSSRKRKWSVSSASAPMRNVERSSIRSLLQRVRAVTRRQFSGNQIPLSVLH